MLDLAALAASAAVEVRRPAVISGLGFGVEGFGFWDLGLGL